jgi:hypothetical protein
MVQSSEDGQTWHDEAFVGNSNTVSLENHRALTPTFYMGPMGTECAEDELILSPQVCETALQQLGRSTVAPVWEGTFSWEPRGCSYKPGWGYFNHDTRFVHARRDRQPVCYGLVGGRADRSSGAAGVEAVMDETGLEQRHRSVKAPKIVAAAGKEEIARLEELAKLEEISRLEEEIARLEENNWAVAEECPELTYFIQYAAYQSSNDRVHILTYTGPMGITWDDFDTCVDHIAATGTAAEVRANHCNDRYNLTVQVLRRTDTAGNNEIMGAGDCCNTENWITATTELCMVHYRQPPTPATTPAPTPANFYVGDLGTECADNELILSPQVCEEALQQLGLDVAPSHWEGTFSQIPRGCSYRTAPYVTHFNHGVAGHGRGDLQPVCRLTETLGPP